MLEIYCKAKTSFGKKASGQVLYRGWFSLQIEMDGWYIKKVFAYIEVRV